MRKPDQHWTRKLKPEESHWQCGFGKCSRPADVLITRIYFQKDGNKATESGGCKSCAAHWAKDCVGCTEVINDVVANPAT